MKLRAHCKNLHLSNTDRSPHGLTFPLSLTRADFLWIKWLFLCAPLRSRAPLYQLCRHLSPSLCRVLIVRIMVCTSHGPREPDGSHELTIREISKRYATTWFLLISPDFGGNVLDKICVYDVVAAVFGSALIITVVDSMICLLASEGNADTRYGL